MTNSGIVQDLSRLMHVSKRFAAYREENMSASCTGLQGAYPG